MSLARLVTATIRNRQSEPASHTAHVSASPASEAATPTCAGQACAGERPARSRTETHVSHDQLSVAGRGMDAATRRHGATRPTPTIQPRPVRNPHVCLGATSLARAAGSGPSSHGTFGSARKARRHAVAFARAPERRSPACLLPTRRPPLEAPQARACFGGRSIAPRDRPLAPPAACRRQSRPATAGLRRNSARYARSYSLASLGLPSTPKLRIRVRPERPSRASSSGGSQPGRTLVSSSRRKARRRRDPERKKTRPTHLHQRMLSR